MHEGLSQATPAQEREYLHRGLEALDRVVGVRPLGYRAPGVDVSVSTVEILLEHGFLDAIVSRKEMRATLAHLLRLLGARAASAA